MRETAALIDRLRSGAQARPTRAQILRQAAAAIMTQANGQPGAVLALLR